MQLIRSVNATVFKLKVTQIKILENTKGKKDHLNGTTQGKVTCEQLA